MKTQFKPVPKSSTLPNPLDVHTRLSQNIGFVKKLGSFDMSIIETKHVYYSRR